MYEYTPLADVFSEEETGIVGSYVAIETRRQHDGPYDVGFMLRAWMSAVHDKRQGFQMSLPMIISWAKMIDPQANKGSATFRTSVVMIGWESRSAYNLDIQMERWLAAVQDDYYDAADYAYKAFEEIHPFNDGNGRTGKIIFNWLNDTLLAPTWPINFWGISNP